MNAFKNRLIGAIGKIFGKIFNTFSKQVKLAVSQRDTHLKIFIKAFLVLTFSMGVAAPADSFDFSDLSPNNDYTHSWDFSKLIPKKELGISWDFSRIDPEMNNWDRVIDRRNAVSEDSLAKGGPQSSEEFEKFSFTSHSKHNIVEVDSGFRK